MTIFGKANDRVTPGQTHSGAHSGAHSGGGLAARYFADVASGKLAQDSDQIAVVRQLDGLLANLSAQQRGWRRLLAIIRDAWRVRRRPNDVDATNHDLSGNLTQSIYIYGSVGRGKSMLMDYFFALAATPRKRRVHFHQFMAEIFAELETRRAAPRVNGKRDAEDPLIALCRQLAQETRLLCFDEFVVTSIAEAMILGRLMGALLDFGVVVVATSNFHPKDLYQGGLHRERFLPFIAMIARRCHVINLAGDQDWRGREASLQARSLPHWLLPSDLPRFNEIWQQKCGGFTTANQVLTILGRQIKIPQSGNSAGHAVARFAFADLCQANLGASDYLAIAAAYRMIFIADIPILNPHHSEAARRFLTLIDALYEAKTELFALAAAPVGQIFAHIPPHGDLADQTPPINAHQAEGDAHSKALAASQTNPDRIASDKTEFSRAISRLVALTG